MKRLLEVIRLAVRILTLLLVGLCLAGAGGENVTQAAVWVGGGLLALLAQGWYLQQRIDQKLDRRIELHRQGCHPASSEDLAEVKETLARMETRLGYIERAVNRLNGRNGGGSR